MKKFLKYGFFIFVGLIIFSLMFPDPDENEVTEPEEMAVTAEPTEPEVEEKEEKQPEEEKETVEEPEEPKELAVETVENGIGETIKVGDVSYTVHERSANNNVGGVYGQNSNGKYLILKVSVKNEGKESLMVDTSLFNLVSGDTEYSADGVASMYANEEADFFLSQVNPGIELNGNVVFDIPENMHEEELFLNVQTGFWGTEQGRINLQ